MKTLLSIIIFIADAYAILRIIGSSETWGKKLLWMLGVILFPVVGFIIWYFAGPGRKP